MLNFLNSLRRRNHSRALTPYETTDSVALRNPDLAIRNLLDDPRLQRALGLQPAVVAATPVEPWELPRRRLHAAA